MPIGTCDDCRPLVTFTPMPLRRAVAVLVLAGFASVTLWACDSDERKDQNYGTDLGDKYVPPEAGANRETAAPIPDAATTDADGSADDAGDEPAARANDRRTDAADAPAADTRT